jgi:hypothetical protein
MSIGIAFMHDYMQLTDIVDLGRYQFIMLCYVYEWQWHSLYVAHVKMKT